MFNKKRIFAILIIFCLSCNFVNAKIYEQVKTKYPDYAYEFLGYDKYENFNRKIFVFNAKLNKFVIRPLHTTWASIMPKYGMDRIKSVYDNIEYPKRLVSTLIQKDFKASGKETVRFLTNSTLGLGGLYDPAKKIFKIEPHQEDLEQALAKCKVKRGPYLVLPVISSCSWRSVAGKLMECPLDPALYVAGPITALVKAGLVVNKTTYLQPLIKMFEFTYADPYDITKKLYGLENYIKIANLDRKEVLDFENENYNSNQLTIKFDPDIDENIFKVSAFSKNNNDFVQENISEKERIKKLMDEGFVADSLSDFVQNNKLEADIKLFDYSPQHPVTDSMRTALFELPDVDKSIWSEISIWNRSFSKKIKTSFVKGHDGQKNYNYRYILQKDKNAPLAIVYPSIGEGIMSYHSVLLAKLFYDKGYSVVIQGSHFHWEFVKSMPENYKPGIPSRDAKYLKEITSKIILSLKEKYDCNFTQKVMIGTSFGAMNLLFIASDEAQNNTLDITKYISINPPIDLIYALEQLDKNNDEWNKNPKYFTHKTAITASKIIRIAQMKDKGEKIDKLPFSQEEAKLITNFVLRQKLSDLIFSLEKSPINKKTDIYTTINNMSYKDYANKYLLNEEYTNFDDLKFASSLYSIADFLKKGNNYKIYHTLNDYFVNQSHLLKLKNYANDKLVLIDNGSHLGFLYREEFLNELKKDIDLHSKM